jgi:transcriptional regulator with XRE-family HTH domain
MDGIGTRLRTIRLQWKLTLREVEERSIRIAQERGNLAFQISASWLDRVERENRQLSATKLIVLAVIYSLTLDQLLAFGEPESEPVSPLQAVSRPNATMLLTRGSLEQQAKFWLPDTGRTTPPPEETTLLPPGDDSLPTLYRRGIIGQRDRTLDPMIRAGSIVLIDYRKRAIASRRDWTHEFDRPIYFLLGRDGYLCGWCELDKSSEWLTLVPHALSYAASSRWRYRKEIEVVGQVIAAFMYIVPPLTA